MSAPDPYPPKRRKLSDTIEPEPEPTFATISSIPDEILVKIFLYLDRWDRFVTRFVCTRWWKITRSTPSMRGRLENKDAVLRAMLLPRSNVNSVLCWLAPEKMLELCEDEIKYGVAMDAFFVMSPRKTNGRALLRYLAHHLKEAPTTNVVFDRDTTLTMIQYYQYFTSSWFGVFVDINPINLTWDAKVVKLMISEGGWDEEIIAAHKAGFVITQDIVRHAAGYWKSRMLVRYFLEQGAPRKRALQWCDAILSNPRHSRNCPPDWLCELVKKFRDAKSIITRCAEETKRDVDKYLK